MQRNVCFQFGCIFILTSSKIVHLIFKAKVRLQYFLIIKILFRINCKKILYLSKFFRINFFFYILLYFILNNNNNRSGR